MKNLWEHFIGAIVHRQASRRQISTVMLDLVPLLNGLRQRFISPVGLKILRDLLIMPKLLLKRQVHSIDPIMTKEERISLRIPLRYIDALSYPVEPDMINVYGTYAISDT